MRCSKRLNYNMADEIQQKLCSSAKIDRDRGYQDLLRHIHTLEEEGLCDLEQKFIHLLADSTAPWETKHGALMGSKALLLSGNTTDDFVVDMRAKAIDLLDDKEFRVRIAAGEVLGALCKKVGPEIYNRSKTIILDKISVNLERDPMMEVDKNEHEEASKLMEKLSSSPGRRGSADAEQIFHDTAGWKNLETSMKCLQSVVEGCGHQFSEFVDQELLDLVFRALKHTNRFVRETGFYVCASIVSIGLSEEEMPENNPLYQYGQQFADYLAQGLADNWSQVRLAASTTTRQFLLSLPSEESREHFFPSLLPKMCLNRYYVAEGVRIYSQDTWKLVTKTDGKRYVEKYINQVVDYYVEATDADNHAVREAACACIAELGAKIDRDRVRPFVPQLVETLIICFNDESWPVRDAACVASGNFVVCFPEESRSSLPALYPLFFNNLQDNIPSVRQGAALAISNLVQAYGQDSLDIVMGKIKEGLDGLEKQPASTEKYTDLDTAPATYGVVKRRRDNDLDLHTDRQMYSCGSLAPKMGRSRGGGCMDHKFRKPTEPWELADGCIHLLAELSNHHDLAAPVSQMLPDMAKSTSYQHYTQHIVYCETICKQLPNIAKGIGKRHFKMHLEMFLDIIFHSLTCDNSLTSSAASQCLNQLSAFLGPNILKGRVEQYNPRYLEQLNANQCIAAL
ncbi:uncharacterized protein LOC117323982 isoform X2 [Pecten maximus]|uniref:uncharacterized protein LOC117323982 isoform X2 n=1 Tax=Pecten maximus TaxID=6579 RepID=UPI001458A36D|nr:uncharacterized protein LOC117323982 isoform X2 [Pecten maximus]